MSDIYQSISCAPAEEAPEVMVVDDSQENLFLLTTILEAAGYQVRQTDTGQRALLMLQQTLPQVLLLDIMMPEMDGYELCRLIKQDPQLQEVSVIFISALNAGIDKAKAFNIGAADYITKPFSREEILARVQQQVLLRHTHQQLQAANATLGQRVAERTRQLRSVNAQLQKMAYSDELTGLANRRMLLRHIRQAIAQERRQGIPFALLYMDCDRFKLINDSLGHYVGDLLLLAIAQRIGSLLPSNAVMARLGGDEFAILLPQVSAEQVEVLIQRLLAAFESAFSISGHCLFIAVSIGVALSRGAYSQPEQILRDADIAMYQAKGLRQPKCCLFDHSMHRQAIDQLNFERELRQAISDQELSLYFQPILNIQTGELQGFEALLRWFSPSRGSVSPEQIVQVAEETGQIYAVEQWVLEEACTQLARWQQQRLLPPDAVMHVNLSSHHFSQPRLLQEISHTLKRANIAPNTLALEITESVIVANLESMVETLGELRSHHIAISIDDFGTGYSSLNYLKHMPINNLKVDRSFVKGLSSSPCDRGIISAVMDIAEGMNFTVTAEGIETQAQLACLQQLGCAYGQGYLFSKPQSPKALNAWLQEPKPFPDRFPHLSWPPADRRHPRARAPLETHRPA